MKLSVIVPVFNERNNLSDILHKVQAVPIDKEIILVNDCSTDGTTDILKDHQAGRRLLISPDARTSLKILFHEANAGKGAAIRTGIKHATGELLIVQDADLEYEPAEYPRLVEPILRGEADVVYGSRFMNIGLRHRIALHTFGNKVLTFISNLFTGLGLTDMETCYKLFRTELIKSIPLRSNRFGFEPEVTAKLARRGVRIKEIPISYHGRTYSEGKKITWRDGISCIWTIIKFRFVNDSHQPTGS